MIFDQGLGDIFSIRIAGNILNEDILGSMEYACRIAGSRIIVVLGHTKCGAIIGACDNLELGHITGLVAKIKPAIARELTITENRNGQNLELVNRVAAINVHYTLDQIRERSQLLRDMELSGRIILIGALYDIDNGHVTFFDQKP